MVDRFHVDPRGVRVQRQDADLWRWRERQSDEYYVKLTYLALCGRVFGNNFDDIFQELWRIKVPPKINIFIWRLLRNRLPTTDNKRKRNLLTGERDCKCPFCKCVEESVSHVLFTCKMARAVWSHYYAWLDLNSVLLQHFRQHFLLDYNQERQYCIQGSLVPGFFVSYMDLDEKHWEFFWLFICAAVLEHQSLCSGVELGVGIDQAGLQRPTTWPT